MSRYWSHLDLTELLRRRAARLEATTSANVGAFVVPLGTPVLRASIPVPSPGYQSVDDILDAYNAKLRGEKP